MLCISLFDIVGIQDFVFATKKTRENVGASSLVGKVFEVFLFEELLKSFPGAATGWRNAEEYGMLSSAPPQAEMVYIGGGNALVAFRNKEDAVALTRAFSRRVLKETGGGLSVAVAHLETDAVSFTDDMKILLRMLERKKFNMPHGWPLLGVAVSREGTSDGLPAAEEYKNGEGGEWISRPASRKRSSAETSDSLSKLAPEGFSFQVEFDRLGRNKEAGESLLAVVHIDGNNMGKTIKKHIADGDGSYNDAVSRLRSISARISEAFEQTLRDTLSRLSSKETLEALEKEGVVLEKSLLPFRPLICAGDDVTFVCDGRIALSLTAAFLKNLSREKTPGGEEFTACAGIAVVKPHFPFYRAYCLSEELCASAKLKAKKNDSDQPGSWLDFEVVYSGLPVDLDAYRARKYSIPGLPSLPDSGEYHLLWRPYTVAGSSRGDAPAHAWSEARRRLRRITGADGKEKEWPRSKLKGLREAFTMSKDEAVSFNAECESRGDLLDEKTNLFRGNRTEWFDIIDLLDVYIEVPGLLKGGDEI